MAEDAPATPVTSTTPVLVFTLGAQRFALPAQFIRRIEYPVPCTRVPGGPPWLEGLANLMGEVVAVVDTRRWLGVAEAPAASGSRWLVLAYEGNLLALTIDQLPVLRVVEDKALRLLPTEDPRRRCAGAEIALDGETITLLDLDCLLAEGT